MAGPCVILKKLQTIHVCGFWGRCRSIRFLRKDDTCGRIQPKQKEKRHECNFNEAVT